MMYQISDAETMSHPANYDIERPAGVKPVLERIEKIRMPAGGDLAYYYFESSRPRTDLPLFVAVHGIRRRGIDQARLFAPLIEAVGGALMAPVFQRKRFNDYQRLGCSGKGARSDLALQRMLAHLKGTKDMHFNRMVMFGYSGGGQFVHRFAMAYPRQVNRMAIAAPGWYTFPDLDIKFPQGVRRSADLPDLKFDAARFLKIPTLALVGEQDTLRDKALNQLDRIDLRQGLNRLERARRWIDAMSASAARFNYATPYAFHTVPQCGHSFVDCMTRGGMGKQVIEFLFDENQGPAARVEDSTNHPADGSA